MKTALLAVAALLATMAAFAADDHAFLGIFAETSSMKMVGMPAMPELPPGMDLSKMPGMAGMAAMFGPQRKLTVRLWSPGLAPDNATASIAAPTGLKQGPRLDLELYRPKAGQTEEETGGTGTVPESAAKGQFTIKRYWGSSETVKAGQPVVTTINWDTMSPEQKASMRKMQERASKQGSYFYKPDWTTGYWPTTKQPGTIAKDAALPGAYALTTNYTGEVSLEVPKSVNFLAPSELETPDLAQAPPMSEALLFHWKAIPNALGLDAQIMGMEGSSTLILWSSSEIPATGFDVVDDYMQMAEVAARVQSTEFMAGTRQDVAVPAGIFKECDMVNLQMIGYGPGAARDDTQPLARVQTKTTLRAMLGGKKMPKMGGAE
ncbi:MAG: hypothetical protein WCP21_08990 [Armatimonadota bacterium]